MTKTEKYNKIIAEFISKHHHNSSVRKHYKTSLGFIERNYDFRRYFNFDISWSDLFKAIKLLEKLGFTIFVGTNGTFGYNNSNRNNFFSSATGDKLADTNETIIQIIEYYEKVHKGLQ